MRDTSKRCDVIKLKKEGRKITGYFDSIQFG